MSLLAASSFERVVIWAPALVIGFGMVGAVCILLGRAFMHSVRESGHPRWIWGGLVALCGVVVLLTYLGIQLPRE
jgi:hypothetical protein